MENRMTFRPLHDRVLVKPLDAEEKSAGGIIIPDTAQEKPMEGKIVAVGNGYKNDDGKIIPLDVKAGDTVLYGKYAGTEVRVDGEDMLIVKESDILAVIEGKVSSMRKAA
jgi:chaperonin GroES